MARRYIKLRGSRWWFQLAVPARSRKRVGKAIIEENLRTRDERVAQIAALERAAYWKREFDADLAATIVPETPAEAYRRTKEAALRQIAYINSRYRDEDDRDFHLDLLEGTWLDPEVRRLGYQDAGEILPGEIDPIVEAAVEAIRAARRRDETVPTRYRTSFKDLSAQFLTQRQRDPASQLTQQTIAQMEATFRLFGDHIAGGPLAGVDRKIAAGFFDRVGQLDRYWGRSPRTKDRSLDELLEEARKSKASRITNRTLVRYASALAQLWEWARGRDEVDGPSPFVAPKARKRAGTKSTANAPWSEVAVRAYLGGFDDPSKEGAPDPEYWLPRVALLTGMRLGEICALERDDVMTAEGVPYFDIPKGKAEGSVRVVPIHPDLTKFLALAPKRGYLFPHLTPGGPDQKRSWNIGKVLGRRFKAVEGSSTFHGFRKNVAEAFERLRVPESEASQIIGHKKAGMTYGVYSPNGLTIQQKADLIAKLGLPAVKIDRANG